MPKRAKAASITMPLVMGVNWSRALVGYEGWLNAAMSATGGKRTSLTALMCLAKGLPSPHLQCVDEQNDCYRPDRGMKGQPAAAVEMG